MKQLIKATLFSVLAATPFLSLNAQAGNPAMYTQHTQTSTVRVVVFQDGKPAAGAKVKMYGADGVMRNEYVANSKGRVVIGSLMAPGPVKLVAHTSKGMSATQELSLYPGFEK
ncbi:hypothetical protein [Sansalvadorimonas verongulae]|uniref:hypothetical protein n=1 Tax=Sansalvadorimonas verongulae TaxID=2172824 RepID=UPI0012BCD35F|nr:hypothetical protein [Sansalvadorimonas verongulae]MTI14612.1 hypothetical protein [Sansalvadorimonas verongulae]